MGICTNQSPLRAISEPLFDSNVAVQHHSHAVAGRFCEGAAAHIVARVEMACNMEQPQALRARFPPECLHLFVAIASGALLAFWFHPRLDFQRFRVLFLRNSLHDFAVPLVLAPAPPNGSPFIKNETYRANITGRRDF